MTGGGWTSNFGTVGEALGRWGNDGTAYDFGSIMHYRYKFSPFQFCPLKFELSKLILILVHELVPRDQKMLSQSLMEVVLL